MVSLIPNYEKQRYVLNSNDDPGDIEFHNGDILYLMDVRQEIIYSEEDNQWYPVPTGGGGGETVYYSEYDGAVYCKNIKPPTAAYEGYIGYRDCPELESLEFHNINHVGKISSPYRFAHNPKLKTFILDQRLNDLTNNNREFQNDTALETVQLGGLDNPVAGMTNGNIFAGCTQSGLTITIYVADDATLPFSGSPFGATNATIIYRSSTTGEVLTI